MALDTWQTGKSQKLQYLANLKERWNREKTPDKETRWLKPEKFKEIDQVGWAWEYLRDAGKQCAIPAPANPREKKAAVLASLDLFPRTNDAERTLFIENSLKRAWSQKKYRASDKAKKPYYLRLTKNARAQLEGLAEHYAAKPTDVLEELIQTRYQSLGGQQIRKPR